MRTHAGCWFVVMTLLFAVGAAYAEEEESPEERAKRNERLAKQTIALWTGRVELVGDERLSDAEAKDVLAHFPSFRAFYAGKGDDTPRSRIEAHYEEKGRYDFTRLVGMPEFLAWASKRGVDGKAWLRRAFRAQLLHTREALAKRLPEIWEQVEELEGMAALMEGYGFDELLVELRSTLDTCEKIVAAIPAPTEAEEEVLEKHGDALAKALGDTD